MNAASRMLICVAGCAWSICAQVSLEWPSWFVVGEVYEPQDSSRLIIGGGVDYTAREGTHNFRTRDSLVWTERDSLWTLQQQALYDVKADWREETVTRSHYLDLAGWYGRSVGRVSWLDSIGLHWSPTSVMWLRSDSLGQSRTDIDVGPTASSEVLGVPVTLRGGISAQAWSEEIPSNDIFDTRLSSFHGTPGVYGGLTLGSDRPLSERVPVRIGLSGYGRLTGELGLGLARGQVLYADGLPTEDSLFVFLSDSLLDGQELSRGDRGDGRTRFISSPWRVENRLHGAIGLKGATRLHLAPSLMYRYGNYLIAYPGDEGMLRDKLLSDHNWVGALQTDTLLFFRYRGSLGYGLGSTDRLFRFEFSDTLRANNLDSLRRNNEDVERSSVAMEHVVVLPLPGNRDITYRYAITRLSTTYPNPSAVEVADGVDASQLDAILDPDDKDEIRRTHEVGVSLLDTENWTLAGRFVANRDISSYVKSQRSASNDTRYGYFVEAGLTYRRPDRFWAGVHANAGADRREWEYPQVHQGASNTPLYSRKLSMRLEGGYEFRQKVVVKGGYVLSLQDNGRWYGAEYFPAPSDSDTTVVLPERFDYYAVESKSTEYKIYLNLVWHASERLALRLGGQFQDLNDRRYKPSTGEYIVDHGNIDYRFEPSMGVDWMGPRLTARLAADWRITRYDAAAAFDGDLSKLLANWRLVCAGGVRF